MKQTAKDIVLSLFDDINAIIKDKAMFIYEMGYRDGREDMIEKADAIIELTKREREQGKG